jgi:hypothetical protein
MSPRLIEKWLQRLPPENHVLLLKDLDRFPELRDAATPPDFTLRPFEDSYLGAADGEIFAQLDGELVPPAEFASAEVGYVDVELATVDRVLVIHTLDIPPSFQLRGLGRLVVAQLAVLGDQLGLETIELEAGKVGRWAWMRCGFDFMSESDREVVIIAAKEFATRLGRAVDLSGIEHSWDFLDLDDPVRPEEIKAAGGPTINPPGQEVPLGKALLLGPNVNANPWFGRLTLDRKSAGRVRLENYVLGDELTD